MDEAAGGPAPAVADGSSRTPGELRDDTRREGRRREIYAMRAFAGILGFLATVVAVVAHRGGFSNRSTSAVVAALIEGALLLPTSICLQLAAARWVQARRTKSVRSKVQAVVVRRALRSWDRRSGGWLERHRRVAGWLLALSPVPVALIVLRACGLRSSGVRGNPFQATVVPRPDAHPVVAAVVLGAMGAALAVWCILLSQRTLGRYVEEDQRPTAREQTAWGVSTLWIGVKSKIRGLLGRPDPGLVRGPTSQKVQDYRHDHPRVPSEIPPVVGADLTDGVMGSVVPTEDRKVVIAMSGGGIRSSAFSLGGFNAVQSHPALMKDVDATVAVSGGSYIAAAIAMTRHFSADGTAFAPSAVRSADQVYRLGDPELGFLRRNSRYLWQPRWRTLTGLIQLLGGAATNLFIAVAVLRAIAWGLGWFLPTAKIMTGITTNQPRFTPWSVSQIPRDVAVGPWLLPVLALIWLIVQQTNRRRRRDLQLSGPGPSTTAWARGCTVASQILLASFIALTVVPLVVVGLSRAAYDNKPTAAVAKIIVNLGLTLPPACVKSLDKSALAAHQLALDRRALTAQAASADYGACGATGTVSVADPAKPTPPDDFNLSIVNSVARTDQFSKGGIGGQLAGVGAVLAGALGLIGRGMSSLPKVTSPRLIAVRHWLLLRVPLTALMLVALWLVVQWTYQFAVNGASSTQVWSWAFVLAGGFMGFLNPNLTSLHEFYRERLSSAFAVGRDTAGRAVNLKYSNTYMFTDLTEPTTPERKPREEGGGVGYPDLVVVATANVNDARVPTRRLGVPLTVGPTEVHLEVGDPGYERGYRSTGEIEDQKVGPKLTVMGAVAMSGAAVSPMMGRQGIRFAPFRLLLTLFNIRLGVWVLNPRWPTDPDAPFWAPMSGSPMFPQLVAEAFGSTSVDDRWLYITDGGHLDNLGLVEAARRRPGWILVFSASNDPDGSWEDVGAAVSVLRSDLGIDLQVVDRDADKTWLALQSTTPRMRVLVVRAAMPKDPALLESIPIDLSSFAIRAADFPRASTGRQDFGDLEFEAYRQLGEWLTLNALRASTWPGFGPAAGPAGGSV